MFVYCITIASTEEKLIKWTMNIERNKSSLRFNIQSTIRQGYKFYKRYNFYNMIMQNIVR